MRAGPPLLGVPEDLHTQRDPPGPLPQQVPQDLHTQRDPPGPMPHQVSSVGLLRELVPLSWWSHKTSTLNGTPQDLCPSRPPHSAGPPWTFAPVGELCRTLTRAGPPLLGVPQDLHPQRDPPGPMPHQVSSVGLLRELVPFFWRSHKTSTLSGTPQDLCPSRSHKTSTLSGTPQDLCPSSSVGLLRELVRLFWGSHKTSTLSGTPLDLCPTR
ncbi:unnamed protein product [Lota lota]